MGLKRNYNSENIKIMEKSIIDAGKSYVCFSDIDITSNLSKKFDTFDVINAFYSGFDFAQQWTSVENMLPDKYVNIFIKSSNSKTIFSGYLNESGNFVGNDFPFEDFINLIVTHWQYIYS